MTKVSVVTNLKEGIRINIEKDQNPEEEKEEDQTLVQPREKQIDFDLRTVTDPSQMAEAGPEVEAPIKAIATVEAPQKAAGVDPGRATLEKQSKEMQKRKLENKLVDMSNFQMEKKDYFLGFYKSYSNREKQLVKKLPGKL